MTGAELVVAADIELVARSSGGAVFDEIGLRHACARPLIGVGIEGEDLGSDGVDEGGGNGVVREGRAGEWVDDVDALAGEVAGLHESSRNRILDGALTREAETFPSKEEETLVPAVVNFWDNHRATDGAAEVVGDLGGESSLAERAGVEGAVLVVPEASAMQFV